MGYQAFNKLILYIKLARAYIVFYSSPYWKTPSPILIDDRYYEYYHTYLQTTWEGAIKVGYYMNKDTHSILGQILLIQISHTGTWTHLQG